LWSFTGGASPSPAEVVAEEEGEEGEEGESVSAASLIES